MFKIKYILTFFLLTSISCFAQKVTQQTFSIHEIDEIRINTDKIFQLNIISTNDKVIKIETKMEGEYFRDLNIITATKNKQIQLSCELAENFEIPNDKLSAHKVFSVVIDIYIPKKLKIQLEGDGTQVHIKGQYKKVQAILISGNFTLTNFTSEAEIQTKKGNIHYINRRKPTLEVNTNQHVIFYKKGRKIELKADNGKITYSADKA
ncbi:hypothetical protein [uncultured Kordia sp.]|uniref:hypothetical protein n=1 Tax=uncultured Kordia sp. TaxID=507699 RepID=UPI0026247EF9|nr:hypothetical protein [uncultured Kordia sp.]